MELELRVGPESESKVKAKSSHDNLGDDCLGNDIHIETGEQERNQNLERGIMLRGTTGRPRRRPRTRGRLEHWNLSQTVEGEIQLNKDNFELRKKRYAQS
ncbi:hypothetical protein EVAR_7746_1 [Eumeta japonica]|uniref:Uncharacterized protein n=1 Tax=Eumeta variegata TaxID=151549 RepID=A0A4C1TK80_EUMVA|nr:hypothetical protein EVAR_7746_1 [Eumeta japonica]